MLELPELRRGTALNDEVGITARYIHERLNNPESL